MAVIFLLGPGMWDLPLRSKPNVSPMTIRRQIASLLKIDGHKVFLMEDDPDLRGEDMIQKFDRLLHHGVTDVVVYWPPRAKMQTTYDELILLCDRREFLKAKSIPVWLVHHVSVAQIRKNEFLVLEEGNRSRYLTAPPAPRPKNSLLKWRSAEFLTPNTHSNSPATLSRTRQNV